MSKSIEGKKVYSGDQSLFSQWDSLIKLAGYTSTLDRGEPTPRITHMFHLVDPLGKTNDGNPNPHVSNEKFRHVDGREVQPAWFAVSDAMPFFVVETTTPYLIGKHVGEKFEVAATKMVHSSSQLDQSQVNQVNHAAKELGLPFTLPNSLTEAYEQFTQSNWYGIVDSGENMSSSIGYEYIEDAQQALIVKAYKEALRVTPPNLRATIRQRVESLTSREGLIYPAIKGKPLPDVARAAFSTLMSSIETSLNFSPSGISLSETTKYFSLTENQDEILDDKTTRFKFFDWYLNNRSLYDEAHNKSAAKLSNEGENPIQSIATTKGETPFWVVIGDKKYKLYLSKDILTLNGNEIPLSQPIRNHNDLTVTLANQFPNRNLSLIPTAIGLVLQLRNSGDVLLPEQGSSYLRQADMVWNYIQENGTPKTVHELRQNNVLRTHTSAIHALPEMHRLMLGWHLANDFTRDEEGYTNSGEIKSTWSKVVANKSAQLSQLAQLSSIPEKIELLFSQNRPEVINDALNQLSVYNEAEARLKERRFTLMENIKSSLSKSQIKSMRGITEYINNIDSSVLPSDIELAQTILVEIEEVKKQAERVRKQKELALISEGILIFFIASKYRQISAGVESLSYYNSRPSLLTTYLLFGDEGVKRLINGVTVTSEQPPQSPPKQHFYNAGGNTFILLEDNHGLFDSGEGILLKQQLISDLNTHNIDSGLILTRPDNPHADCRIYIIEKDGSISAMCGNGTRAVADLYYTRFPERQTPVVIEVANGATIEVSRVKGGYSTIISSENITHPDNQKSLLDDINNELLTHSSEDSAKSLTAIDIVSVLDEPHLLINTGKDMEQADLLEVAKKLNNITDKQGNLLFPQGINVNFVSKLDSTRIAVLTFERGVNNFTLSCGTGAVSAAMAYSKNQHDIFTIVNSGASLSVTIDHDTCFLSGPANKIKN